MDGEGGNGKYVNGTNSIRIPLYSVSLYPNKIRLSNRIQIQNLKFE